MEVHPQIPPYRARDPKRRAEIALYTQLAESGTPGYTLYEAYPGHNAPQLDYAIWLDGIARIALQCKGGQRRVHRGNWQLDTSQGWEYTDSPVTETRDSAIALREAIDSNGGRGVFVIAALIFPDMGFDQFLADRAAEQKVADRAAEQKVHTLFGYENLVTPEKVDRTGR